MSQRELTFTLWPSVTSRQGTPATHPWQDWLQVLSQHDERPTKGGPCLTLCLIPAGSPRKNKHVIQVDGFCLDIDRGTDEQIGQAIQNFKRFEFILHSTHSHGKPRLDDDKKPVFDPETGAPIPQTKIRAVFPLSRTIDPKEHKRLWQSLSTLANGLQDEQTKAVSHPFYMPSRPPGGAPPILFHNQGEWLNPDEFLAAAPNPLSTKYNTPAINQSLAGPLSEAIVQEQLSKMQGALRHMPKDHELKEAATKLLKGEPYAEPGERHKTQIRLTGWLAFKSYKNPLSPETLERLFGPSLDQMDDDADTLDQIIDSYETAVAKATEHKENVRTAKQVSMQDAAGQHVVWTAEDVERCAQQQGCDPKHVAFLLQRANSYFILNRDATFGGPYTEKDAMVKVFKRLATSPIALYEQVGEGYRPKTLVEIARQHGEVAEKVVADLAAQATWYDPRAETMHECASPLIHRPAIYDEQIAHWLSLFAGPAPIHEKLLAWLACSPDLLKMLCALVIVAEPGTGKTLFAQGLASLWAAEGATASVESILSNYNDDLARCPVVFADETLPRSWKWENVTTKLRAEIATLVRTLNRKYYAPIPMHGAIRFLLATNNPMILASEISTQADLKAIAQRFLYIQPKPEAEEYLASLPVALKNEWRTHKIAQHVLWLQQNHAVEPEGRFWVVGDIQKMHRLLVTSSNWNSWICEWIVKGLGDGFRKIQNQSETNGRVQIRDGELYVNTNAISEGWQTYTNYPNINPDPRKIATALRSISKTTNTVQLRPTRFRYFEIDLELVIAWAEQQGSSSRQEIAEAMGTGIKQGPKVVDLDEKRREREP